MGIFKNMDLYKAIILLSVVLIPAAGVFVYSVDQRIKEAEQALNNATRQNGELERIGRTLKQLQSIQDNLEMSQGSQDHRKYFEARILRATTQGLKRNDFTISEQRRVGAGVSAQDMEVSIEFEREGKDFPLPRAFISAALFNCESGSRSWKLRNIKVRNEEVRELRKQTPPKTVEDDWRIEKLTFARREPNKSR